MLTTSTLPQPTSADSMTDAELHAHLAVFDTEMRDGQVCNFPYMWQTAKEKQSKDIQGDAFIVALALASLTRVPRIGVSCTHAAIALRASALKKLFAVADKVGWPRIMTALGITSATMERPTR
jgi:hypothetical protein